VKAIKEPKELKPVERVRPALFVMLEK